MIDQSLGESQTSPFPVILPFASDLAWRLVVDFGLGAACQNSVNGGAAQAAATVVCTGTV